MTDGAATYGKRLRDLEAEAFRTGRALAEHTDPWYIDSNVIEQRLETIECIVFALARAQGIDPAATD